MTNKRQPNRIETAYTNEGNIISETRIHRLGYGEMQTVETALEMLGTDEAKTIVKLLGGQHVKLEITETHYL